MSEGSGTTVRALPSGPLQTARERSWDGNVLEIELLAPQDPAALGPGVLVQVDSADHTYLGAVLACEAARVRVDVEHAIDRERLSRIREAWE